MSNNLATNPLTNFPFHPKNKVSEDEAPQAFESLERIDPRPFAQIADELRNNAYTPWRDVLKAGGESALKYLEYTLQHGEQSAPENAAYMLKHFGAPALPLLRTTLWEHPIAEVRYGAARSLAYLDDAGLDELEKALDKGSENQRLAAAIGLWARLAGHEEQQGFEPYRDRAIALMKRLLRDSSVEIRERALSTLMMADALGLAAIDEAMEDEVYSVRQSALGALGWGQKYQQSDEAARVLAKALEDSHFAVVKDALDMTGSYKIAPERVLAAIVASLIVRDTKRPETYFNREVVAKALAEGPIRLNPRLQGQILSMLCDAAYTHSNGARKRSVAVARLIDEDGFKELVEERKADNPAAAKEILRLLGAATDIGSIAQELSKIDPGDVQKIAASQINILGQFHQDALKQAKTSYWLANVVAIIGLTVLVLSIVFFLLTNQQGLALTVGIGATISEFIALLYLRLREKTQDQLAYYHREINHTQRFLLANSLCESLEGEAKQQARVELIKRIAAVESSAGAGDGFSLPS